jgi:hypothetical protein
MTFVPKRLLGAFSHFRSISYLFPNHACAPHIVIDIRNCPGGAASALVMVACGSNEETLRRSGIAPLDAGGSIAVADPFDLYKTWICARVQAGRGRQLFDGAWGSA